MFSTDRKDTKNNGRVEDVGEGILPLSQCENSEKVRSRREDQKHRRRDWHWTIN